MNIPSAEEALLQDFYQALKLDDLEKAKSCLHPSVRWTDERGRLWEGPEGVAAWWRQCCSDGRVLLEDKDYSYQDGRIHVRLKMTVPGPESRATEPQKIEHVFRFRAGLIEKVDMKEWKDITRLYTPK